MIFKQIKRHGDNFSYVIADDMTREAAVVDPSFNEDALIQFIEKEKLNLKYIINTHHHADHTASNESLKARFKAKIVAHKSATSRDVGVVDGQVLNVGGVAIKIIHTLGHTPDGICLLVDNKLVTGDTLFVGECGRTDLADGSSADMYNSLFNKLLKLDDTVEVYPGHDYGSQPSSTIGRERKTNYTLKPRTLKEFVEFMSEP